MNSANESMLRIQGEDIINDLNFMAENLFLFFRGLIRRRKKSTTTQDFCY